MFPLAALGAMLLVASAAGGATGIALLILSGLSLPLVVWLHRRVRAGQEGATPAKRRAVLRTPGQVATAVVLVAGGGALAAAVVSVLLAVGMPSLAGDGSALVRSSLVVFVLGPCVSLGRRCGRWWAFVGSGVLVPLLGFAALVTGAGLSSGVRWTAVAVLTTALALALGSLQSEVEAKAARYVSWGASIAPIPATSAAPASRPPTGPSRRVTRPVARGRSDIAATVPKKSPASNSTA